MSASPLRRFLSELRRRRVVRVAVAYAAVGWLLIEVSSTVAPELLLPEWVPRVVIFLVLLGFPLALVLAWAFDLTPEGVRRTQSAEEPVAAEADEPTVAPADAPSAPLPEGSTPSSRRAIRAFVGLGIVAAAAAGGWYLTASGDDTPETGDRTVAVLPFEVSGSTSEDWSDGMVTFVTPGLDGVAGLRAIPDRTVFAAWEEAGEGRRQAGGEERLAVARRLGAHYAVSGTVGTLGSEVALNVDVRNVRTGARLGPIEIRGSPDSVMALADSLARRVLGVLLEESEDAIPSVELKSLTTSSPEALTFYVEGERRYRAGDYEAAVDAYRAAIRADSAFALAWERLAYSRVWIGWEFEHAYRRAYELSDPLPPRDRRVLWAEYAWIVEDRALTVADSLRALADVYPDDPRVWYNLGEVLIHGLVPRGWPEAEEAFERAADLDPGVAPYHHHLVDLAMSVHHDGALTARRIAAHPEGDLEEMYRVFHDLNFGTPEARRDAWTRLDTLPIPGPPWWVRDALSHPTDRALQEEVLRRLLRRDDFELAEGDPFLVQVLLQRGRLDAALSHLGESSPGARWALYNLAGAASLGIPVPDSTLRRHFEPSSLGPGTSSYRLLSAGIYLVDEGREAEVDRVLDRLRENAAGAEDTTPNTIAPRLAIDELRGYRAWRAGDRETAAHLWSRSKPGWWWWGAIWRGDLFREMGRPGEAEGWYLAAWQHPVAHERLGRLYEEMDRPEDAAAAYRRFTAAWVDADPPLQERVEAARARLEELPQGREPGAAAGD